MKNYYSALMNLILGIILFISGGCAFNPSSTTNFYILSPLVHPDVEQQNVKGKNCKAIGVGPLNLPGYLDRPEIVTRVSANELKLAELDNWAEPLKDNMTRVLVENISRLICTKYVVTFPWNSSSQVDYQIEITIVWMDGELGKKATLSTQWTIIDESSKSILLTKTSHYTESVKEPTYSALAAAYSRLIADFSQDIVHAIESLS